jgi:hypothetical protein
MNRVSPLDLGMERRGAQLLRLAALAQDFAWRLPLRSRRQNGSTLDLGMERGRGAEDCQNRRNCQNREIERQRLLPQRAQRKGKSGRTLPLMNTDDAGRGKEQANRGLTRMVADRKKRLLPQRTQGSRRETKSGRTSPLISTDDTDQRKSASCRKNRFAEIPRSLHALDFPVTFGISVSSVDQR